MIKVLSIFIKRLVDDYRERFVLAICILSAALQPVVSINQNQQQQQRFLVKKGRPR
jgi:hypothetical protein